MAEDPLGLFSGWADDDDFFIEELEDLFWEETDDDFLEEVPVWLFWGEIDDDFLEEEPVGLFWGEIDDDFLEEEPVWLFLGETDDDFITNEPEGFWISMHLYSSFNLNPFSHNSHLFCSGHFWQCSIVIHFSSCVVINPSKIDKNNISFK